MSNLVGWGWMLCLDIAGMDGEKIRSEENVSAFVAELVKRIDMIPYGDCWVKHFATHDPDKAGISFCQMIETSNITGHLVDKDNTGYIDVFSCKPYDQQVVMDVVNEFFGCEGMRIRPNMITRQAH